MKCISQFVVALSVILLSAGEVFAQFSEVPA